MTADVRPVAARDPELPALAAALREPGTELLGHRPGRRAVLREADGHYLKVVRPGRTGRIEHGLREAAARLAGRPDAPAVPRVCAVDPAAGWVRLAELSGPNLHELLRTQLDAAVELCGRVAAALAALRRAPTADLPQHTHADEAAVLHRWLTAAGRAAPDAAGRTTTNAAGRTAANLVDRGAAVSDRLLALPEPRWALCHRDLHDKQLVRLRFGPAGAPTVGLLDLDTLCIADPALDPANLLAHFRLRTLQGHCRPTTATRCARILHAACVDDGVAPAALEAYTAIALLRLAAVYTFRPGPPDLPARLAAAATELPVVSWPAQSSIAEPRC